MSSTSAHVTIDIHTVPLYVPPPPTIKPLTQILATYIYRPVYTEYPITVIHPDDMV
jgi:hypothetical protein